MIKQIVMDFDGTLLPYGHAAVGDEVRTLLDRLREKGKTLVFSSGRTYGELLPHLSAWENDAYFIVGDGAYTVYRGKNLYERKIELEDLVRFFRQNTESPSFLLHGARQTYGVGELPREAERFAPLPIQRIGEIKEKIFKVTTYGGPLMLPPLCGLRTHWDGTEETVTQYVNRFANKGAALSDLQVRLMISGYETACLGDSDNDLAMMRNAKLSYCVGDRSEALRKVCNRHIATVADGLRELLEL